MRLHALIIIDWEIHGCGKESLVGRLVRDSWGEGGSAGSSVGRVHIMSTYHVR